MAAYSWEELFNLGKAEAILRRPALVVREGDISDMLLAGGAAMADRVVGYAADRFRATYLDGARDADLTALAADHWSISRQAATPATLTVTFTRTNPDGVARTIAAGAQVATARDAQGVETRFVTTQAAAWGAGEGGTKVVTAEASVAGVAGNVTANAITRLVDTPPAGGTYTVTASTAGSGGTDAETDTELRDRVRAYPSTLRRGTLGALEYGALQVPGVKRATAIEGETGDVTVYVSDADGGSSGATVTSSGTVTDDSTMTHKVAIQLQDWRAAGSLVTVVGGTVQTVDVTVALTVRLGVNVAALVTAVQAAITAAVNRLQIGETLYKSAIQMAARQVNPDAIREVTVTAPATDTAPTSAGHIIRPGTVTVG